MQQSPKGGMDGLVRIISRERRMVIIIAAVLILAFVANAFLSLGLQYNAKEKQAKQEAKALDDVQKFREDLSRQQVLSDAKKKAEFGNTLKQFISTFLYDANQINESINEYGQANISDRNLAQKAAAAKKFALAVNEYASHVDGMKAYVQENAAELQRLGADMNAANEGVSYFENSVADFRSIEPYVALDLESFANKSSARMAIAGEAISMLREAGGST